MAWRSLLLAAGMATALLAANAERAPETTPNETPETASHLHILETCLSDAEQGETREESCIGVSVAACLEEAFSTVDMLACIDPELTYWDDRLNDTYRSLYAEYAEQDTADDFSPIVLAPTLREVQRVWITWRDAKCSLEYDKYRGGSMGRITGADCHLQETAERALELEYLLEEARF